MPTVCATNTNNNDPEINKILFWIFSLTAAVLFAAVLCSCKTIQPTERVIIRTDTVRQHQRDSIFIHFTDTVREQQRGDTIFIENIKWRTAYKEFLRTDTIIRVDSVATTNTVIVAKMNGAQRTFFWIGIVFSVLLVLWLAWKIYKLVRL